MGLLNKKFEFHSDFTKDKFIKILESRTDSKNFKFYIGGALASDSKMFTGIIKNDSFEIIRNFQLFNSFRPSIFGKLKIEGEKLRININVKIKPTILIIFFSILLLINLFIYNFNQIQNHLMSDEINRSNGFLIIILIDFVGTAIIFLSFYIEKRLVIKELQKLFKLKLI